jgi:hypothetical protein
MQQFNSESASLNLGDLAIQYVSDKHRTAGSEEKKKKKKTFCLGLLSSSPSKATGAAGFPPRGDLRGESFPAFPAAIDFSNRKDRRSISATT